ncbi:MAG: PHB depolymerase family esterase [Paracoccus sp. (in: a-proteobacteria)]|nr:PHB depolymerase family esterase [Paracoccus sp. (in: a-proteobacteria)]
MAAINDGVFYSGSIRGVTTVTQVFPDGQKAVAAIVEFAAPLSAAALDPDAFSIDGRSILSARVTALPQIGAETGDGPFLVIDLDPGDESAAVYRAAAGSNPTQLVFRQTAPLARADGDSFAPGGKVVVSTRLNNLIVDDFRQFRFADPETGLILNYNLFTPANPDPAMRYPLVLFMHDAGVTGTDPLRTLEQGLGAVVFASPDSQAAHPAFVLAPQYPVALANDAAQTSAYPAITARLVQQLQQDHPIDPDRIYATGQSGGCMTGIALNVAYPDLFGGTFCVAGQWDAAVVAPMAAVNFWALVSQDDAKAFPGMTAVVETLRENGARVATGTLDAKAPAGETARTIAQIRADAGDSNVIFTSFTKGSVLPADGAGGPGAGHVNTWLYAYGIPAIRDWLFDQRRKAAP